mmetsp:Transcript_57414/g.124210  ORF Transcript_57414/g.124210 Transcript_57414/m.124210 type:complete len:402 (-) Transcript_57414:98-1303(-)
MVRDLNRSDDSAHSEEELLSRRRDIGGARIRAIALGLGIGSLLACTAAAALSWSPDWSDDNSVSARALLESQHLSNVAADQMIRVAHLNVDPKKRGEMRESVSKAFKEISHKLEQQAPDAARQLEELKLKPEHRRVVLNAMQHLSDRRLMHVGLDVALAIQEAKDQDAEGVKRHIQEKLRPRIAELRALRDEILPEGFHGKGSWDNVLHPKEVRLLKSFGENWRAHIGAVESKPKAKATPSIRGLAEEAPAGGPAWDSYPNYSGEPAAAAIEEATTTTEPPASMLGPINIPQIEDILESAQMYFDQLREFAMAFTKDLHIPILSDLLAAGDDFFTVGQCELDALREFADSGRVPISELMSCPMQLSRTGLSAIGALLADFGVDGTPFGFPPPTSTTTTTIA